MIPPRFRSKDHAGAALLILMGIAVASAGRSYRVGTLTLMGAGYIPTVLGVLLVAVGVLLGLTANRAAQPTLAVSLGHSPAAIDVRSWGFILGGIAAFVLLGEYGGFVPATFACVFISSLGDRQNSLRDALLLASVLVIAGYLIFCWGLKLQLEPFKWG